MPASTIKSRRVGVAKKLRSLLVAIDLSPSSARVVGRAALVPLAAGGRIRLLHVLGSIPSRSRRRAIEEARKVLSQEAARLAKTLSKGTSVGHTVTVGSPASEIADRAARAKVDLVVMGRGAGRSVRDAFLGSTAERVVREGRVPVLVVRLAPRHRYRRPVLGLDLDKAADGVLAMALRVIEPPRPRLAIVHAYDLPYVGMSYSNMSDVEIEAAGKHYRQTAATELSKLFARALPGAVESRSGLSAFRTYFRYGSPRSVIKAYVKKVEADLLLLGTHGYSGLFYGLLGTVAGDVLRDVPCDVLVVPPRVAGPHAARMTNAR